MFFPLWKIFADSRNIKYNRRNEIVLFIALVWDKGVISTTIFCYIESFPKKMMYTCKFFLQFFFLYNTILRAECIFFAPKWMQTSDYALEEQSSFYKFSWKFFFSSIKSCIIKIMKLKGDYFSIFFYIIEIVEQDSFFRCIFFLKRFFQLGVLVIPFIWKCIFAVALNLFLNCFIPQWKLIILRRH